ncbi:uncharacterized protein LOC110731052 [Chenopodium quinoa]|uniref:uncharacterized protein LOC110731052 n=1 Tax=Chenopodium quinoa TaxID=63459 RepID=UPI000B77B53F|nr:uncharacterized protein LOC110731052 [Chenopodium quinoa]
METRAQHGIFKPKVPFNLSAQHISPIPRSLKLALLDLNWNAAMNEEFLALTKQHTWDLVPKPDGVNVIRCMWLFKHKFKEHGDLERYKALLVVNGKSQQLDVKNSFLHGDLIKETVYMHQLPGFVNRSSPTHIGFVCSQSDNSLFIFRQGSTTSYLLLYVDDIVSTTSSATLTSDIISFLKTEFDMTDLGKLSYFLGISVTRTRGRMFLCQRKYAEEIINRAKMSNCKPVSTPVDCKSKLSAFDGDPVVDPSLYRSLAGALQYLTFTRPDIAYAVQQICLFMHAPREPHFNALKRIIRYLKGTADHGFYLYRLPPTRLVSYTNVDWGGCPDTRRSTSGYCVFLGDNLVSWSTKRQAILSKSSDEAEYRAVANVVAETCWLRNLLLELHCPLRRASLVYYDNISTVYLSSNPVQHQRTKHIEIDIHFVREKVAIRHIRVLHVPYSY